MLSDSVILERGNIVIALRHYEPFLVDSVSSLGPRRG